MSDGRERLVITSLCLHCGGEFDSYQACPRCQPIWLEGGTPIAIADLAERVHELAAVRWDADIVPHELPMEPRPRLYRDSFGASHVLLFGGTGGRWKAIAVWRSGFDPVDHDLWVVRRAVGQHWLGTKDTRIAEHVDDDAYAKLLAAFPPPETKPVEPAKASFEIDRDAYVYEGPNGTPRPAKDFSPNTRLKASFGDLLKVK